MSYIDDLPQRHDTHDLEEASKTALEMSISTHDHFVIQGEDANDYGTDVHLECRDGNKMTNIRAHTQLKATDNKPNSDGSISISGIARSNLNYLLAHPNSIYVCYHRPSDQLYVRYAEDVYREYEHSTKEWTKNDTITIRFIQFFNEEFQKHFRKRLLQRGKTSRDRRLLWTGTPPEQLPQLIQEASQVIDVPADPIQARAVLEELYKAGKDRVISDYFEEFDAVLGVIDGQMDLGYMAEINLGINGEEFDEDRVRRSLDVFQATIERGTMHKGSMTYCIGNAFLALEEYEVARDAYNSAMVDLSASGFREEEAMCAKNLASTMIKLGHEDAAIRLLDRAIELNPDLAEAHYALSILYQKQKSHPELALEYLDQVATLGGTALRLATVQGWRIDLLYSIGDEEAAFREINSVISQASQFEWIWPWCAKYVALNGNTSVFSATKAIQFWRKYLKEHPDDLDAELEMLLCIGYLRKQEEPTPLTFEEFEVRVAMLIEKGAPDPAFLWNQVGRWAQFNGDWRQAEIAYRKAYDIEPQRYGFELGKALNLLNRHEEALPISLEQAQKHFPHAMSWFDVAIAREGTGNIEGAIAAYEKAIGLDADYDLAWFNLGGLHWNAGSEKDALKVWKEALERFPNHEQAQKLMNFLPEIFNKN